jgi:hypothetical protein
MHHDNTSTTASAPRRRSRRGVAVLVGVTAMLSPLVTAPAAPAYSGVVGMLDQMLVTGYGGPGGDKPTGLGSTVTAVLDAVSDLVAPSVGTTRAKAHAKARHTHRHH